MKRFFPIMLALSSLCAFDLKFCKKSWSFNANSQTNINDISVSLSNTINSYILKNVMKAISRSLLITSISLLPMGTITPMHPVWADDELAQYAAQGNEVGVDGQCFIKKCGFETSACANDPNCLKGLSCLARCKGGSLCSTGCFAKFGSKRLDNLLYCSVEKHDCVHVPGKETLGWTIDNSNDLPFKPSKQFNMASMQGTWYKVMGLDSRYDCFDCQRNKFEIKSKNSLKMETVFRIPRQTFPGYLQNKIIEDIKITDKSGPYFLAHMQSKGQMFGLTFWENWYMLSGDDVMNTASISYNNLLNINRPLVQEKQNYDNVKLNTNKMFMSVTTNSILDTNRDPESNVNSLEQNSNNILAGIDNSKIDNNKVVNKNIYIKNNNQNEIDVLNPELKFVFYTGHTLQGSYKGAFILSRSSQMSPSLYKSASLLIRYAGLSPTDFCIIRNECFLNAAKSSVDVSIEPKNVDAETPFWFIGQKFYKATESVASELADWFQDPAMLSDWLVNQQQRMVLEQPMAVSPFASLIEESNLKEK